MPYPSVLALVIGCVAAFPAFYARFGHDFRTGLNRWGIAYHVLRGFAAVGAFKLLHVFGDAMEVKQVVAHPCIFACLAGVGWEALLRSRFHLHEREDEHGTKSSWAIGGYDLVRFYERFFLNRAATQVGIQRMRYQQRVPFDLTFDQLCRKSLEYIEAHPWESSAAKKEVEDYIVSLQREKKADRKTPDRALVVKLAYRLRASLGPQIAGALLDDVRKARRREGPARAPAERGLASEILPVDDSEDALGNSSAMEEGPNVGPERDQ